MSRCCTYGVLERGFRATTIDIENVEEAAKSLDELVCSHVAFWKDACLTQKGYAGDKRRLSDTERLCRWQRTPV